MALILLQSFDKLKSEKIATLLAFQVAVLFFKIPQEILRHVLSNQQILKDIGLVEQKYQVNMLILL